MKPQARTVSRAVELMRIAAPVIRDNLPALEIPYDETVCDGHALADDLESSAEMLELAGFGIAAAAFRVRAYLHERSKMRALDQEEIHGLHGDDLERGVRLTAADLTLLISHAVGGE